MRSCHLFFMLDKNAKILVTGGTGFIGSYLIRHLLAAGYQNIVATKRPASRMDLVETVRHKVRWIDADVLDLPALEEAFDAIDYVFHCAAIVAFDIRADQKMMQINEDGTANIVNLSAAKGVKKLVHVSSIAAIGRSKDGVHIDEKTSWETSKLNTRYAVSKYLAEMQVWRGIAEGLNAAIVNPAIVLGSGFWEEGSAHIFKTVFDGFPFYPTGATGFVDVRDVVRFMAQLMESDVSGERFILSGANLSHQQLFEKIAAAFGKKPPRWRANAFFRAMAWRGAALVAFFTGKPSLITRETVRTSANRFFYENAKSKSVFNFEYTPIDQTIEQTAAQFLQSKKEGREAAVLELGVI